MSEHPPRLVVADDDPIFRLGLTAALQAQSAWQVVAAVSCAELLRCLASLQETGPVPQVLVLDPLGLPQPGVEPWALGQTLGQLYPALPILLLTGSDDPRAIAKLRALGLAGYRPKGTSIPDLLAALNQLLAGEPAWPEPAALAPGPALESAPTWLLTLRRSGLQQIDQELAQIFAILARGSLTNWSWFFWRGRQRELQVARWLVQQLLPVEVAIAPPVPPEIANPLARPDPTTALVSQPQNLPGRSRTCLEVIRDRLQQGSHNQTGFPLELDILRPAQRQELLYLTLRELEKLLAELQFLEVTVAELRDRLPLIRRELWQATVLTFASKYYTPLTDGPTLTDTLLAAFPGVDATALSTIPLLPELLAYLLYDEPLVIDHVPYRPEAPEAQARAEVLVANLTLQVARAVMQFLLNQFAEVESLKYALYDPRYRSSREIARFRNDLSWHARQNYYFSEPRAIFESRYRLLVLQGGQVRLTTITAPRLQELQELQGLRWLVTIAWETRDALAPRLRALIAWLGRGVVYVLTQVVGKAIGLIGRGVLQGFGNAVQESRYRRK